jgi:CHAT domain-containing protein/tetratricopeptide (TPR) repeat protein
MADPCTPHRSTWAYRFTLVALAAVCWLGALIPVAAVEAQVVAEPVPESVRLLLDDGFYFEGTETARRLLGQASATHGTRSKEAAEALDLLVEALILSGRWQGPEAPALAEDAVALRRSLHGPRDAALAPALLHLGMLYRRLGGLEDAEPPLRQAVELLSVADGAPHPDLGLALGELGLLMVDRGEASLAKGLLEEALEVLVRAVGPTDPLVAKAANNKGVAAFRFVGPAASLPWFERALAIREVALPPGHPLVGESLLNLGMAHNGMGDTETAESLYRQALELLEPRLGGNHPMVARTLNSLAVAARLRGDLVRARALQERVVEIFGAAFGEAHPQLAGALNNLGNIASGLGDLDAARLHLERALEIREKALGSDRPEVAQALHNLSNLYLRLGELEAAEAAQRRALTIRESALGGEHYQTTLSLYSLGNLLLQRGALEEAQSLLERCAAIRGRTGEGGPRGLAEPASALGMLHSSRGEHEAALRHLLRAMRLMTEAVGPDHPAVGELAGLLAIARAAAGDPSGALEAALQSESVVRQQVRLMAQGLSEREALQFVAESSSGLDLALSLASEGELSPEEVLRLWDSVARSRKAVFDETALRRRLVRSDDPEIAARAGRLADEASALARLLVRGPGGAGATSESEGLRAARGRLEESERRLGELSAHWRSGRQLERAGWPQIVEALPPDSALVAFVRYLHRDAGRRYRLPGRESYLALVVEKGGVPRAVPLGAAAEIEELVTLWQRSMVTPAGNSSPQGGPAEGQAETAARVAGESLRRRVWDPMAPLLSNVSRVFLVPDGALHLVNMAALPWGDGYLVEGPSTLHLLSVERDLVDVRAETVGAGVLAVGGADFSAPVGVLSPPAEERSPRPASPVAAALRSTEAGCAHLEELVFEPLEKSTAEVREVAELWASYRAVEATIGEPEPVLLLGGAAATEAAVKSLAPGRRVLHLATHGFYLEGDCVPARGGQRGVGGLVAEPAAALDRDSLTRRDDPQERAWQRPPVAGLALAGANHRHLVSAGEEDGILTAEEIALLDLEGMEWAVLSACDSGVGALAAGEGVLGLRRAFRVAGARTVIMSLWAVEDGAAREWMGALYRARLVDGLDTAAAVRRASLEVLERRRAEGESTHPGSWGAFVAAGDWR